MRLQNLSIIFYEKIFLPGDRSSRPRTARSAAHKIICEIDYKQIEKQNIKGVRKILTKFPTVSSLTESHLLATTEGKYAFWFSSTIISDCLMNFS